MSTLRTIKKLLLGETWLLPAGIAATLAAGELLRRVAPEAWRQIGGPILLAGVLIVLVTSVRRTSRPR
jgi:hypothetical protein